MPGFWVKYFYCETKDLNIGAGDSKFDSEMAGYAKREEIGMWIVFF